MSGFLPFVFSMCANDVSAADSSVSLYFSRFSHLFRRFFIPLRPVVVIQYFSLLFKRESGWNPERYRHCKCGSSAGAKAGHWGDPRRLRGAEDAQVRRPAQRCVASPAKGNTSCQRKNGRGGPKGPPRLFCVGRILWTES